MRSPGEWQSEIGAELRGMRDSFVRAQSAHEPDGADLTVLGTALRADQARGIIADVAGEQYWTRRGDQVCLDNSTDPGRIHLGFAVGRDRVLSAGEFMYFLVDIGQRDPELVVPETNLARFLNLVVVEPEHELTIWLTAAHLLATGQADANLYAVLPELRTDHDVFYPDIPEGARFAEQLRPEASPTYGRTMAEHQAHLLADLQPGVSYTPTAFAEHEPLMSAYIRQHVWSRVAGVLAVRTSSSLG